MLNFLLFFSGDLGAESGINTAQKTGGGLFVDEGKRKARGMKSGLKPWPCSTNPGAVHKRTLQTQSAA